MTTQTLETRLREKIVTETPRPGFEKRIQAMAREPFAPEKTGFIRRFAVPAMAVLSIFVVIAPGRKPPGQAITVGPRVVDPTNVAITESINEAPVQREIQGLKNDARRTMSLFQKALPSFTIRKKQQEE